MFERKHEKLASRALFIKRMLFCNTVAIGLVLLALTIGVLGYRYFAGYDWIDAFLEASMILGGMGPINTLPSDTAKVFAACYALFSGLVFIMVMGIVLAPLAHRMLHKFHIDDADLKH